MCISSLSLSLLLYLFVPTLSIQTGGMTNLIGGLNLVRTRMFGSQGDRPNVDNMLIVITDGVPTIGGPPPSGLIDSMRRLAR